MTAALCQRGVAQLTESETEELWLIADASDLRKPYASEMPDLMQVKDLDGKFVPGYRALNVLGVTRGRPGILYHRLFSNVAEDFDSEPWKCSGGLKKVSQAVHGLKERMAVSWIVDRGFDDVAVWRTIWEQEEHVVCCIFHSERLVEYQTVDGKRAEGDVVAAQQSLRPMASARTEVVVRRRGLGYQQIPSSPECDIACRVTLHQGGQLAVAPETTLLGIDEDSDGDIDDTIELRNETNRVYLPLVLRGFP